MPYAVSAVFRILTRLCNALPPSARVAQGHIASIKEMDCIIAIFDQDGDSEFNLVSFDFGIVCPQ